MNFGGINQGANYNVDIVMCIDATGSMAHIIDEVKANALSFYQKFVDEMNNQGKNVDQLRIKVIAFRDYAVDSEPMIVSDFFVLDEQKAEFQNFVNKIEAMGGGDLPENGLEALALAINSDWTTEGAVRRHVILMYTDAEAKPLGVDKTDNSDMPTSIADLRALWEGQMSKMENRAKRLLIFAPEVEPWNNFVGWQHTFHTASEAGKGLEDVDITTCINLLVRSI